MPYTRNGNTRIYCETVGSGPPLLLQPGFGLSSKSWQGAGYVDALRDQFTVILTDPRGVGKSDKPHDPLAYASEKQVADMTTVLDKLGYTSAHLWGYSTGAMRGWDACRLAPHRFRSMVLGGGNPNSQGVDGTPNPMGQQFRDRGIDGMVEMYLDMVDGQSPDYMLQELRSVDIEALAASVSIHRDPHPELFIETLSVPILGYSSSLDRPHHDEIRKACEMAPNGRFVSMPWRSYMDVWFNVQEIVPVAVAFMLEIEHRGLTASA